MTDWAAVALEAVLTHQAIQKPAELAALLTFLEIFRPGCIIEIGSDHGGTLWAWSQLPGPPRVISVDLPHGGFAGRDSAALPEAHGAILVTGSSRSKYTKAEVRRLLGGDGRADMLFIDADHTYEGVSSDFRTWKDLVRPGGLVIFHDITPHTSRPEVGVPAFWRDLTCQQPRSQVMEIRTDRQIPTCGIGILSDQPLALIPGPVRVPAR